MTLKEVESKLTHHAGKAFEAWKTGNMFDYAIETARFELANAEMRRRSVELALIMSAIDEVKSP